MTDLGVPITRVVCRRQSEVVQRPPVFSSQRRSSSGLTGPAVEESPSGHPTAQGQSLPAPAFRALQHDTCGTRLAARRRGRGSGTARVESVAGVQRERESRIGAFVGPALGLVPLRLAAQHATISWTDHLGCFLFLCLSPAAPPLQVLTLPLI